MYEKTSSISSTATGAYPILCFFGINLSPNPGYDFIVFKQLSAIGNLLFCNQQLGLQFNTGLHASIRFITHDNQVGFTITGKHYGFVKLVAQF